MRKPPRETPSVFGMLLFGVVALVTGATLGTAILAARPVEELLPGAREPDIALGQVTFRRGVDAGSSDFRIKLAQMEKGVPAVYYWTEPELNRWSNTNLRADLEIKVPYAEWLKPKLFAPNFRLEGDRLQIALVIDFPEAALPRLVGQVSGKVVKGSAGPVFVAETGHIGSFPLHAVPGLAEAVTSGVAQLFTSNPKNQALLANWPRLDEGEVSEGLLKLRLN